MCPKFNWAYDRTYGCTCAVHIYAWAFVLLSPHAFSTYCWLSIKLIFLAVGYISFAVCSFFCTEFRHFINYARDKNSMIFINVLMLESMSCQRKWNWHRGTHEAGCSAGERTVETGDPTVGEWFSRLKGKEKYAWGKLVLKPEITISWLQEFFRKFPDFRNLLVLFFIMFTALFIFSSILDKVPLSGLCQHSRV